MAAGQRRADSPPKCANFQEPRYICKSNNPETWRSVTLLFLYLVTGRIAPNDTALTFAAAFSTIELVAGNRVEIGDADRRRVEERAIPWKKVWRQYSPRLYTLALFPQDSCTSRLSHPIGYITRPPHIITAVTRKWYKMHDNKLTLATKRFSAWKVWEINSVKL